MTNWTIEHGNALVRDFDKDLTGGYLIESNGDQFRWVWIEPSEDSPERGNWLPSESEAIRAAADNWAENGDGRTTYLAMLRGEATKARKRETAVAARLIASIPTTEQVAHAYCDGLAGTSRTREESDAEFRAWLKEITIAAERPAVDKVALEHALTGSLSLIGSVWREWSAADLAKFITHEITQAIAAIQKQKGTQ